LGSHHQEDDDAVVVEVVTTVDVVELVEFPVDAVVTVLGEDVEEFVESVSGVGVVDVVGGERVREVFESGMVSVAKGVSVAIEVVDVARDDKSVGKVELVELDD